MFDSPEEKAALKDAIEKAVDEAKIGLDLKNKDLIARLQAAQKGRAIDPAEVEKLEAKVESITLERDAALKQAKDALKISADVTKRLEVESGFTHKLLIDNGLTSELTKHGITNPVHLKAAQAMLRGDVKIAIDGESRMAKVGEKALADFVKEWAGGDEGKHFVTAANNSGGGSAGGNGSRPGVKTATRSEYDAMIARNDGSASLFFREGGALTDA